jgi:hypothetical protein
MHGLGIRLGLGPGPGSAGESRQRGRHPTPLRGVMVELVSDLTPSQPKHRLGPRPAWHPHHGSPSHGHVTPADHVQLGGSDSQ